MIRKSVPMAIGLVLVISFIAGPAWSQDGTRMVLNYDAYLTQNEPTPAGVAPEEPTPVAPTPAEPTLVEPAPAEAASPVPDAPVPEPTPDTGYAGDGCGRCSDCGDPCGDRCCGCGGGKPWTLPQPCFLQERCIKIGGWLQQGVTFNAYDRTDGYNGPLATNDFDSEYQMNQLWLYLDRPVDTGGYGWDVGGHVDLTYGTDWRFGVNYGLEDNFNGFGQSYGLVIPQMYLEVALNNLSVKLGHFAGILDYEAVPGIMNPFYSHSYSYGYTVPQLVTGVMCDYKLSEQWSVQGGFHRGWMMWEDMNNVLDGMAGLKWNSRDKRSSMAYAFSSGPQDAAGQQDRFVHSLVLKRQMSRRLQYILVHNLGVENNGDPRTGEDAEWYGINQYFLYTLNPRWSLGMRFEWLRDDDGARIFGVGNMPWARGWDGGPGFSGDFYELTLGLNWRPRPNLLFRPEVRWDWYEGTTGLAGELPFKNGTRSNQVAFGVDFIILF